MEFITVTSTVTLSMALGVGAGRMLLGAVFAAMKRNSQLTGR